MAIDIVLVMDKYVYPLLRTLMYGILGVLVIGGLWWWLFVIKKRRFWLVDVYEQKSDGKLYLVQKDRLQEKKINFGKKTIFTFKKTNTESVPPPFECVQRLDGKEYADYVRILGEYVPLQRNKGETVPDFNDVKVKRNIFAIFSRAKSDIRSTPTTIKNASKIYDRYVYIPLYKALKYDIDYKPIAYDVNMMRLNEIDNLEQMFKAKQDFWAKWGALIGVGIAACTLIVVVYFSIEYMKGVMSQSFAAADKVAGPLKSLVEKISGNTPPQ